MNEQLLAINEKDKKRSAQVIALVLFCVVAMALVDGLLKPEYYQKSMIKAALFLVCPFIYSRLGGKFELRLLFRCQIRDFGAALLLGAAVYALIVGGYFAVRHFFDFSAVTASLSQSAGVDRQNFLAVSLYISFINSLLEEFFFRGFAFLSLSTAFGSRRSSIFSAAAFSLYHAAMLTGWFSPLLFALILLGLFIGGLLFNHLNSLHHNIYPSWLVHMCANFAINTVGLILYGIL